MMSGKQSELEGRLDDMLSRIAMETQEIKELEQQLTDGQILANECLQKDLEEIICGLQEYLRGLREQARRSQQQVLGLQLHLEDSQGHCRQLEDTSRTLRRDMLRMEAQALRDRQVESSRQQAELQQLREELTRQTTMGQTSTLYEDPRTHVDQTSTLYKDSRTHVDQTSTLYEDPRTHVDQTSTLYKDPRTHVDQTSTLYKDSRTHVDQTRIQLDQITATMMDPQEVQSGPEQLHEDKYSVERLYRAVQQTRTRREPLQRDHVHCQERVDRLPAQLVQDRDRVAQLEAQVTQDQDQEPDWRLKEELETLRVHLQRSRTRSRHVQHKREAELQQSGLQLQDLQQERDALLQQMDGSAQRPGGGGAATGEEPDETLRHRRTRTRTRTTRTRDPGHSAPSLGSLETQDSGLGLQYLSSPERGRQQDGRSTGGGYWVYVPPTHTDSDTAVVCSPPAGGAVLLCNIPEHRDTQGDRCVCECVHKEAERLEEEKKKLQLETKQLRQRSSVRLLCEEVQCVEKTLLKRRAELRQADRLLLEAQSCLHTTRDKELLRRSSVSILREEETRAELKQLLQELRVEQEALEEVKRKRTQSLQRLHKKLDQLDRKEEELDWKEEELDRMREELDRKGEELDRKKEGLDRMREELDRMREELDRKEDEVDRMRDQGDKEREEVKALQQEVESHRKTERQEELQEELQELQEELSRRREERSSLQEQCKHLEARRRHADRSLSGVEAELTKQREELTKRGEELTKRGEELTKQREELTKQRKELTKRGEELTKQREELTKQGEELTKQGEELSHAQLLQQEVVRDVTDSQEQLNENSELLSERLEEKKHLQDLEQEESEEDQSFYLSTAGLSCEEEKWKVELQREELRQREERLKARLRCSLWTQQETLKERRLETRESLQGLRDRVDTLDSLLTRTRDTQ